MHFCLCSAWIWRVAFLINLQLRFIKPKEPFHMKHFEYSLRWVAWPHLCTAARFVAFATFTQQSNATRLFYFFAYVRPMSDFLVAVWTTQFWSFQAPQKISFEPVSYVALNMIRSDSFQSICRLNSHHNPTLAPTTHQTNLSTEFAINAPQKLQIHLPPSHYFTIILSSPIVE